MKTWLIQRAKFEDREYKNGIDSIISLDYMGSSEFEFGALPKSLGNIRNELNQYTYLDIPFQLKDKVITVFCKDSQKTQIKQYLRDLSENKIRLKEKSYFDSYMTGEGCMKDKFDFWWDIENDLMFWKKSIVFESKFKAVIVKKAS